MPPPPLLHLSLPATSGAFATNTNTNTTTTTTHPPPKRPPPSPWAAQRLWSGLSVLSKRSHRSFRTSSFEADDERSETDFFQDSSSAMSGSDRDPDASHDNHVHVHVLGPRYSGQDLRPTSAKELLGWYSYAFAAETYVVCAIGSFIPILLESLARENGVLAKDRTKPCPVSDTKEGDDAGQCVVNFLGVDVSTASFAMYTFSISVLAQALLVVSISSAADHGNYRKRLLLGFGWVGGLSVMAYIFISGETYLLGAFFAIVSNTSFGASFVLLNSFLPLLVRHHPDVLDAQYASALHDPATSHLDRASQASQEQPHSDDESLLEGSTSALHPHAENGLKHATRDDEVTSVALHLSTQISTKGVGIGYSAALFVQCLAIGIVVLGHNTTFAMRVALLFIGSWWVVFTIPSAMFLRPRPGPPLASDPSKKGAGAWLSYVFEAWASLFRTIKLARHLVDVMLFLGGWFLLSDAIATTSSTAILFAKNELHMKTWSLGLISVVSTTAGVAGAFSWAGISKWLRLQPHQTMLACIVLFECIPVYGLLGYLPFVQDWGVVGLQRPWEMYPLAAMYGFVLGGLSGYSRSLYGQLIPPGSEAAFYALYAITDKGSSVFGPAIVGAIIDRTGGIRPAFWFLLVVVGLPAPLIWFVDVRRGRREGERIAQIADRLRATGLVEDSASEAGEAREAQGILAAYEEERRRQPGEDDSDVETGRVQG